MKIKNKFLSILLLILLTSLTYSYNPVHLKILNNFVSGEWYKWRKQNPNIKPDLSGAIINRCDFFGDFSNVNFQKARITEGGMIPPIYFINSNFNHSEIINVTLIMTSMTREKALFKNTGFYRAKINDSSLLNSNFINVNFNEAEIQNTKIDYTTFKNVTFIKAKINSSELWENFYDVDFSYAHIVKTTIASSSHGNKILNSKFNNAKIYESTIAGTITNLSFVNADLTGSSFLDKKFSPTYGTIMENVNFTNANLTNVNFQKATFKNVIFKNADMTGAKIERKWYDYIKKQDARNFDKIKWE